jgi:hypothetical protein
MMVRAIVIAFAAVLLAVQIVRTGGVNALGERRPADAARFWSRHPDSEISLAMTEIARAARASRPVPTAAFAMLSDAATKEPLAAQPYLVRGVQAQLAGDGARAQQAFEAAQWRDPRSLPAAYFLADRYFRVGQVGQGLDEIAALARLSPAGAEAVGPYLAAYAKDPRTWPALRNMFRENPRLGDLTLETLASNVATVPAALALAGSGRKLAGAPWLAPMLDTLVSAGDYRQAHGIWATASGTGAEAGQLVHDASFKDTSSPPPFNWSLSSSTVGLAERQAGGRLHVVFYGREDGFLASQLLLLPPGTYRLGMRLLGDPARARSMSWSVWCDKAAEPLASATLDVAAGRGLSFAVPPTCPAQWLRLGGTSSDMPQQSDLTIASLQLVQAVPGA